MLSTTLILQFSSTGATLSTISLAKNSNQARIPPFTSNFNVKPRPASVASNVMESEPPAVASTSVILREETAEQLVGDTVAVVKRVHIDSTPELRDPHAVIHSENLDPSRDRSHGRKTLEK